VYTTASDLDPHWRQTGRRLYTCTNDLLYLPDDVNWATVRLDHRDYVTFGDSAPDKFLDPPQFDSIELLIASWEDSWSLFDAVFPKDLDPIVRLSVMAQHTGAAMAPICLISLLNWEQRLGKWKTQPLDKPCGA
jgi:hypothetical protein